MTHLSSRSCLILMRATSMDSWTDDTGNSLSVFPVRERGRGQTKQSWFDPIKQAWSNQSCLIFMSLILYPGALAAGLRSTHIANNASRRPLVIILRYSSVNHPSV